MDGSTQEQMLSENDRRDIDKEMRLLWFLWAGNMGVPIAAVTVCHGSAASMGDKIPIRGDFPLRILEIVLAAVGLFSLAIAYFLRKSLSAGKWEMFKKAAIEAAASSDKPPYLLRYRMNVYIPMAIPASLAIYGMVLFMFGAGYGIVYAFAIVSALGVFSQRPGREEIIHFRRQHARTQSQRT